jgi:hypothetical protein
VVCTVIAKVQVNVLISNSFTKIIHALGSILTRPLHYIQKQPGIFILILGPVDIGQKGAFFGMSRNPH